MIVSDTKPFFMEWDIYWPGFFHMYQEMHQDVSNGY